MFPMVTPGRFRPRLPSAGLERTGRLFGVAPGDPSGASL